KEKSVIKKTQKKKKKNEYETSPLLRFNNNNTIRLSIMIIILITVSIVEAVMYVYSRDSIKSVESVLPSEFIQSLKVFQNNVQTDNEFLDSLPSIKAQLNSVLIGDYKVQDIVVTNENMHTVYSSLYAKSQYIYKIKDNPSSFKLIYSPIYTADDYRTLFVQKEVIKTELNSESISVPTSNKVKYNIYLIVPKPEEKYENAITGFVKIFFSIVMILTIIISYMLSQSIVKPLATMEQTISKISDGDLSGRLDYTKYYEINKLVQAYNLMVNALQRLYSTLENQVQERTKELKSAYAELQNTQAMMVHSEKMKSLGELVAGIMHEINNPINFIYGNMVHLSNYSNDLIQIIDTYSKYDSSLKPEELKEIKALKDEIDYEFLKSDMPDLIKSCKEGADRAKNIIQDLKSFSRMEEVAITDVDIPHEIDTTLNILHNKIKNKANVHKEYMENVPKIEAFGGQLNQVFMNIFDNAVGAIEKQGDIWIRINTDKDNKNLVIEIEDNGMGMDEETARKVFNPFFTTKPVGQGTGLGMSITYKIIKNHQGDIKVESTPGVGSKFIITLPINIDREALNESLVSGGNNG
ncbi:MAG: ATP-binding protein, partial [Candidatus Gastranaerophilales bacterium]|nr:ATP-binding protein [Candidatus Gastranaerophilales bacterium]